MSNELKIEAGKYYKLWNCERAYVALTNKPGERPIVGWLDDGRILNWYNDGSQHGMDPSHFDIVSEWVEPERIPWEHLPKWCRWWVKDFHGCEWGTEKEPARDGSSWITNDEKSGCVRLPQNLHSNYTGDWRNSLRERPEGV